MLALTVLALAAALPSAPRAQAADSAMTPEVRAAIAKRLGIRPEDIRPAAIAGLYEVSSGAEVGYVSADGRHYVDGDIFEMSGQTNLTEERRGEKRLALLKGLDSIVFSPQAPVRHRITVFTDVDCVHCRRLHNDLPELLKSGIEVRYLMYPRTGPDSESWHKAEAVWCSKDRQDALTRAKRGEKVTAASCPNPVAKHYEMVRRLGFSGTPSIVTDSGAYIRGYPPTATALIQMLKGPAAPGG